MAGQQVLGMRLTWNKRYITLAPLRLCLGWRLNSPTRKSCWVARRFRYYLCADPDHHAGRGNCRRHFPLNVPFQNGPTRGKDSSYRSITSSGGRKWPGKAGGAGGVPLGRPRHHPAFQLNRRVKSVALATGAYAHIRRQFKSLSVRWKGLKSRWRVLPVMPRDGCCGIADYLRHYARRKTSVLSAIVKYHCTHRGQQSIIMRWISLVAKALCSGKATSWRCLPGRTDCHHR